MGEGEKKKDSHSSDSISVAVKALFMKYLQKGTMTKQLPNRGPVSGAISCITYLQSLLRVTVVYKQTSGRCRGGCVFLFFSSKKKPTSENKITFGV